MDGEIEEKKPLRRDLVLTVSNGMGGLDMRWRYLISPELRKQKGVEVFAAKVAFPGD